MQFSSAAASLQPPSVYTVTHTFLLNLLLIELICHVSSWCSFLSVALFSLCCCYYLLLSAPGSFKVSSYLMKYVLPHWHALKRCASAPVDLGVCLPGCVCCVRAPLSARAYTSSRGDDISERRTGSSRPSGGQSLKWDFSTSDPCSGPLTFYQENRNDLRPRDLWAATVFLQVATPRLQPTVPKPGRRSVEVRPGCVEDYRGVKWRVYFQKDVLEKGTILLKNWKNWKRDGQKRLSGLIIKVHKFGLSHEYRYCLFYLL